MHRSTWLCVMLFLSKWSCAKIKCRDHSYGRFLIFCTSTSCFKGGTKESRQLHPSMLRQLSGQITAFRALFSLAKTILDLACFARSANYDKYFWTNSVRHDTDLSIWLKWNEEAFYEFLDVHRRLGLLASNKPDVSRLVCAMRNLRSQP